MADGPGPSPEVAKGGYGVQPQDGCVPPYALAPPFGLPPVPNGGRLQAALILVPPAVCLQRRPQRQSAGQNLVTPAAAAQRCS